MKEKYKDYLKVGYGMLLMLSFMIWYYLYPYWIYFSLGLLELLITLYAINKYYLEVEK